MEPVPVSEGLNDLEAVLKRALAPVEPPDDLGNPDARARANLPYLMQGVTTVVTNNDGGGDE